MVCVHATPPRLPQTLGLLPTAKVFWNLELSLVTNLPSNEASFRYRWMRHVAKSRTS